MAERNSRDGATLTGITPQVHGDALVDKLNRETSGEIADLKKKINPQPKEGEAPADEPRMYLRFSRVGWPYAKGALSISSGETVIPGSGISLGTIYKGEVVYVELFIGQQTNTGGQGYTSTELWGTRGQGSPVVLMQKAQPYFATPGGGTLRPWFVMATFEAGDAPIAQAEIRIKLGSAGGTISVPDGAALYQRASVYTPITRVE